MFPPGGSLATLSSPEIWGTRFSRSEEFYSAFWGVEHGRDGVIGYGSFRCGLSQRRELVSASRNGDVNGCTCETQRTAKPTSMRNARPEMSHVEA